MTSSLTTFKTQEFHHARTEQSKIAQKHQICPEVSRPWPKEACSLALAPTICGKLGGCVGERAGEVETSFGRGLSVGLPRYCKLINSELVKLFAGQTGAGAIPLTIIVRLSDTWSVCVRVISRHRSAGIWRWDYLLLMCS